MFRGCSRSFFIGILAYFLMGGKDSQIKTTRLVSRPFSSKTTRSRRFRPSKDDLADKAHKQPYEIGPADVLADPRAKAMDLDPKADLAEVGQELQASTDTLQKPPEYSGITAVDLSATDNPVLNYAVQARPTPGTPQAAGGFQTLGAALKGNDYIVAQFHHAAHIPAHPAQGNRPAEPGRDVDEKRWVGPISGKFLDDQIARFKQQLAASKADEQIEVIKRYPVTLYATADGKPVYGVDGDINKPEELRAGRMLPAATSWRTLAWSPRLPKTPIRLPRPISRLMRTSKSGC